MRKLMIAAALLLFLSACAPVTVTKSVTDYTYENGQLVQEYKETITQVPESRLPITLRHSELFE